jgi:transcription elongation factor GreA
MMRFFCCYFLSLSSCTIILVRIVAFQGDQANYYSQIPIIPLNPKHQLLLKEEESTMPANETLLTAEGIKKLEEELRHLKTVKRPGVSERIKVAIGFGDISENAEYEDAKNEQAFIEGRIKTVDKMLRNVHVINTGASLDDTVSIGTTVMLKDLELGGEVEYKIVGTTEADPGANKISNVSPVGKAVLKQKVGAVVDVKTPVGVLRYQILGIRDI